jgi:hypothetical protein
MGSTERHPAQAVAGRAGAISASRTGRAQVAAQAGGTARHPAIAADPTHRLLRTLVQRVLARPPKPPALDGLPKAPG